MFRRTMLLVALLCLVATAALAQTPPYTKTIIVGDTGIPAVNGANLLAAVATPVAPGPNNRWLVFVEPGTFDLGGATLLMRDYVDVSGSGRNSTVITSGAATTVRAPAGIDTELRELTVENRSQNANVSTGVRIETERFLLTLVNVEIANVQNAIGVDINAAGQPRLSLVFHRIAGFKTATGIRIGGRGAVITDAFVFILAPGTEQNIGVEVRDTGGSTLDQVSGFVSASAGRNVGIDVVDSAPSVFNNRWTVDGNNSPVQTYGLQVRTTPFGARPAELFVRESDFIAQGSTAGAVAAQIEDQSRVEIQHSNLQSIDTPFGFGIGAAVQVTDSAFVWLKQSVADAGRSVATQAATTLRVGASQLAGARVVLGASTCAQSYDGAFIDIPNGPC
ncbi:MAG: hypothetical protein AAGD38_14895 [Acidobacteriota bacterium]